MKTILLCAAFLASISAHAQEERSQDRQLKCYREGSIFQQAASQRDINLSPQQTFSILKNEKLPGIDEAFIKKAINLVYFNQGFANAGGQALMMQVAQQCMDPNSGFRPLQ